MVISNGVLFSIPLKVLARILMYRLLKSNEGRYSGSSAGLLGQTFTYRSTLARLRICILAVYCKVMAST